MSAGGFGGEPHAERDGAILAATQARLGARLVTGVEPRASRSFAVVVVALQQGCLYAFRRCLLTLSQRARLVSLFPVSLCRSERPSNLPVRASSWRA